MKLIGITGKSGTGKTTLANCLVEKLNCKCIDVDKIGHMSLTQDHVVNKLCEKFGRDILDENGKINRKKLGNIVFGNTTKMEELTDITWAFMEEQIDVILCDEKDEIVILEWILLPKSKFWDKCDLKILVKSDDEKRKTKVLQRDNISEEYFEKRDSSSIDYSEFIFDFVFNNKYDEHEIKEDCRKIYDLIK